MAIYFFDTSALVKRYSLEDGRRWVQAITDPRAGNQIYVARVTGAEAISAFMRNVRANTISAVDAAQVIRDFTFDFTTQYEILEITDVVVGRAMTLIQSHKLRGYDGIQLAVALELNDAMKAAGMSAVGVPALTMAAADSDLAVAALAEGLIVENPAAHLDPSDTIS